MAQSYNGWPAAPGWSVKGGQLAPLIVAGEPFSPGVRAGDVHTVLQYVAQQLHNRVEPVVRNDWHQADDWGYSYRANLNNPSQLSCHASGTAIDYNATRHPNGKGGTWTAAQKREIQKILAEVSNVVRCLFGYDEMHFEICASMAEVARVAQKLRGGPVVTSSRHPIVGAIKAAYDRQALRLGQAKGPEVPTADQIGRWQEFDGGAIYWHPHVDSGRAHIVWGDILKEWRRVGSEPITGYPITDELPCPDGVGRFNYFAGAPAHGRAAIYWHPKTGAHPVWGGFLDWWAYNDHERGPLGYPTSGEYVNAAGVTVQDFQGGQLRLARTGVIFVPR